MRPSCGALPPGRAGRAALAPGSSWPWETVVLSRERRAGWFWMTRPPPRCCGTVSDHFCFPDHFCPCGASPVGRDPKRLAALGAPGTGSPCPRGVVGAWGGEEEHEPGAGWVQLGSVGIMEEREAERRCSESCREPWSSSGRLRRACVLQLSTRGTGKSGGQGYGGHILTTPLPPESSGAEAAPACSAMQQAAPVLPAGCRICLISGGLMIPA